MLWCLACRIFDFAVVLRVVFCVVCAIVRLLVSRPIHDGYHRPVVCSLECYGVCSLQVI